MPVPHAERTEPSNRTSSAPCIAHPTAQRRLFQTSSVVPSTTDTKPLRSSSLDDCGACQSGCPAGTWRREICRLRAVAAAIEYRGSPTPSATRSGSLHQGPGLKPKNRNRPRITKMPSKPMPPPFFPPPPLEGNRMPPPRGKGNLKPPPPLRPAGLLRFGFAAGHATASHCPREGFPIPPHAFCMRDPLAQDARGWARQNGFIRRRVSRRGTARRDPQTGSILDASICGC